MKVTEGFQEFQCRGKPLNCKHSRLGGTDLSEQTLQNAFKNFNVGGSDLSGQKVTEGFQEVESRGN